MSFHVRCRKCATRRALPKHLDDYKRIPACRVCGARNYRPDKWMNTRDTTGRSCRCGAYPALAARGCPHQRGSRDCQYNYDGTLREVDALTYETPRKYRPTWIPF